MAEQAVSFLKKKIDIILNKMLNCERHKMPRRDLLMPLVRRRAAMKALRAMIGELNREHTVRFVAPWLGETFSSTALRQGKFSA
jgi:hypothetical protein